MSAPQCPSCKAALEKMPQRKTKCKACGEFMFVKSTPDNREKRLMTQAQAEAAEQEWSGHSALAKLVEQARVVGVDKERVQATFDIAGGDFKRAADAIFRPLALARNRDALLTMAHYVEEDPKNKKMWMRLVVALDLKKVRDAGFSAVQIFGSGPELCPVCHRLNGTIISSSASAMAVIPADCTCDNPGHLVVSSAIRRADGSVYFDRAS